MVMSLPYYMQLTFGNSLVRSLIPLLVMKVQILMWCYCIIVYFCGLPRLWVKVKVNPMPNPPAHVAELGHPQTTLFKQLVCLLCEKFSLSFKTQLCRQNKESNPNV